MSRRCGCRTPNRTVARDPANAPSDNLQFAVSSLNRHERLCTVRAQMSRKRGAPWVVTLVFALGGHGPALAQTPPAPPPAPPPAAPPAQPAPAAPPAQPAPPPAPPPSAPAPTPPAEGDEG